MGVNEDGESGGERERRGEGSKETVKKSETYVGSNGNFNVGGDWWSSGV